VGRDFAAAIDVQVGDEDAQQRLGLSVSPLAMTLASWSATAWNAVVSGVVGVSAVSSRASAWS
jgi:uncharacterized membrane protein YbhN (UPF0104 family)